MGLLATSIRAEDVTDKLRYLNSVRAFANVVTKNYVGKNGGVTNGLWGGYREEWWASTATAGALLFLRDAEGTLGEYLEVALRAFDWMPLHDLRKAVYLPFEQDPARWFSTTASFMRPHCTVRRYREADGRRLMS
jgi:hypothetical protein